MEFSAMTIAHALTFKRISKDITHTCYEGTYLNHDEVLEQHQINIRVMHKDQQQELTYQVILENTQPTAQLTQVNIINSQILTEATRLAQSIIAFHQNHDSYALSLLNEHV